MTEGGYFFIEQADKERDGNMKESGYFFIEQVDVDVAAFVAKYRDRLLEMSVNTGTANSITIHGVYVEYRPNIRFAYAVPRSKVLRT